RPPSPQRAVLRPAAATAPLRALRAGDAPGVAPRARPRSTPAVTPNRGIRTRPRSAPVPSPHPVTTSRPRTGAGWSASVRDITGTPARESNKTQHGGYRDAARQRSKEGCTDAARQVVQTGRGGARHWRAPPRGGTVRISW